MSGIATLAHATSSSQESHDACDVEPRKLSGRDSGNRGSVPGTGASYASTWRPRVPTWNGGVRQLRRCGGPSPFPARAGAASQLRVPRSRGGVSERTSRGPRLRHGLLGRSGYLQPSALGQDDVAGARPALNRLAPSPAAPLPTPKRLVSKRTAPLSRRSSSRACPRGFGALPMRCAPSPHDIRTIFDAAAFTSLALMFAGQVGELPPDQRQTARADAITFAQRVFAADPNRPGGVHYLIHAADDPELAPRGSRPRRYAEIAPESEHAQHMPSHIFVKLGLWSDAVASDERAFASSRAEVKARKLSNAELTFTRCNGCSMPTCKRAFSRVACDDRHGAEVLAGVDVSVPAYTDADTASHVRVPARHTRATVPGPCAARGAP